MQLSRPLDAMTIKVFLGVVRPAVATKLGWSQFLPFVLHADVLYLRRLLRVIQDEGKQHLIPKKIDRDGAGNWQLAAVTDRDDRAETTTLSTSALGRQEKVRCNATFH